MDLQEKFNLKEKWTLKWTWTWHFARNLRPCLCRTLVALWRVRWRYVDIVSAHAGASIKIFIMNHTRRQLTEQAEASLTSPQAANIIPPRCSLHLMIQLACFECAYIYLGATRCQIWRCQFCFHVYNVYISLLSSMLNTWILNMALVYRRMGAACGSIYPAQ